MLFRSLRAYRSQQDVGRPPMAVEGPFFLSLSFSPPSLFLSFFSVPLRTNLDVRTVPILCRSNLVWGCTGRFGTVLKILPWMILVRVLVLRRKEIKKLIESGKRDQKARGIWVSSVVDDFISDCQNLPTAHDIWTFLKEKFSGTIMTRLW